MRIVSSLPGPKLICGALMPSTLVSSWQLRICGELCPLAAEHTAGPEFSMK